MPTPTDTKKKQTGGQKKGGGDNGDGGNRLKKFYDSVKPVVANLPEYSTFRDKLTNSRARRKTFYDDLKKSGKVADLPDNFSTFERKLFQVEPDSNAEKKKSQFDFPADPNRNPFSSIIGFQKDIEAQDKRRQQNKERQKKQNSGMNVIYNIRRNQKLNSLNTELEKYQTEYEKAKQKAQDNATEVGGYPHPVMVPEPKMRRKAQRLKEKRDEVKNRIESIHKTMYDQMDSGDTAAHSAINSFVRGTLQPLSADLLKSASNIITMMSPPGVREMRMATQQDQPLYQAGEQVGKAIDEQFPENPKFQKDFWIKTLPATAGFVASTVAADAATGGLGLGTNVGGAIIGSASVATHEFENALNKTGDPQKAFDTFLYNLPVGAIGGIMPGKFFKRLNEGTDGAVVKTLEDWVKTEGNSFAKKGLGDKAAKIGADFVKGGTEGFFQQSMLHFLTNVGAHNIYDKTRSITEGVMTQGGTGFLIGSFLNGFGRALNEAKQSAEGRRLEEIRKSEEFINEQQRRLVNGEIPQTAQGETAAGQKHLQTQIDFGFDPNAPLPDQIQKLKSERARLDDEQSQLKENDKAKADYEMALAQINDLISNKQSELESGKTENAKPKESSDKSKGGEKTNIDKAKLPEDTKNLINEIDSAKNPATEADNRRGEVMAAAKDAGLENVNQRETTDLLQELRSKIRSEQASKSEEPKPGAGEGKPAAEKSSNDQKATEKPTDTNPYPNVSEDAQAFLEGVDATGIHPPNVTGRLQKMAEDNGIKITEDTTPQDIIKQLRTKGAGLESPPVGRPVPPAKLTEGKDVPYNNGLAIAARNANGDVYIGGRTHSQLINQFDNKIDIGNAEMGFYTQDGQFLTRSEATQWLNKQKEAQPSPEGKKSGEAPGILFSEDLVAQSAQDANPQDIHPGMQVQWNKNGADQFSEPRRVREVETDSKSGKKYAKVDGEKNWLPVEQLNISDPKPTQSEEQLQSRIQYASDITDLSNELASNNYDEASTAAKTATAMALDNGVKGYEEFYAMTAEAMDGKPNPQALRNGWEQAMADKSNSNKLAINNGEGSLGKKFNDSRSRMGYQFMLQMYNENHPITVMEKQLSELYNDPNRFKRENIDKSVDTFLKLMPGKLADIWDRYLNPRKRYSKMGNIVRESVARELNMADFGKMSELYGQLSDAKKSGDTAKANEIENQINELAKSDDLQQFLIAQHAVEANDYVKERLNREKPSQKDKEFQNEVESLKKQIPKLEEQIKGLRGQRRKAAQEKLDELKTRLKARTNPLGLSTKEAYKILDDFKNTEGVGETTKYDDLMKVGQKVWEMERQYLQEAADIGVITPESQKRMNDTYKFHIPANRIITDEYGNVTGGVIPGVMDGSPKIYERQGSDRMIGHVLTNITHNFDRMMRYGMKNKMRVKTADIMREEQSRGNPAFGKVKADHEVSMGEYAVPFREVQQREVPTKDGGTETKQVIQQKNLVFSDKGMYEMYRDLNSSPVSAGAFMSGIKAIMNLQHFTIIGGSLSFGPSNQFRDMTEAMQNSLSELGFKDAGRLPKELLMGSDGSEIKNWKDFMKKKVLPYHQAMVRHERTGATDTQATKDYATLKKLGGTTSFYRVMNQEKIMNNLQKAANEMQAIAEKKPSINTVKGGLAKIGNAIDYWNNMWENSTRTVLFRVGKDAGMSDTRAAEFALETMPNFNRMGKLGRKLNNNFLFFNASVAATASHGFAWRDGAAKTLTSSAAIAMAAYLNSMYNDTFGKDKQYEKDKRVNTWKYHKNIVFNNYDEKGNVKQTTLPLGYSPSVYWGIGGDLYDMQQGYIDQGEFDKRLATNMADVYNPMSGADMFKDTNHGLYAMTPTWIKPGASMATNVIFGGNLYKKWKLAQPGMEDWQLSSPYTPKPLRYASEWLNKNDIADVSPKTLDLWYNWVTNSAGKDIAGFKQFYNAFADKKDFNADQLPILRRFYNDMNKADINYRSIWNRITQYNSDAPAADSKQMKQLLSNIEDEYKNVTNSDVIPGYQVESLDGGIQTYIDFLHDQKMRQKATKYFNSHGWDGKDHRKQRYAYYRRENYKAKEFPEFNVRYKWENGRFHRETSTRKAFSGQLVESIEGKFKTPGEKITYSSKQE